MKSTFNQETTRTIFKSVNLVDPRFDVESAQKEALKAIDNLELKDRVRLIASIIQRGLRQDSLSVIPKAARNLEGFLAWPLIQVLEDRSSDLKKSELRKMLNALAQVTERFTSEFAVRPVLQSYFLETIDYLSGVAVQSPNEHVRRWASEGTRPSLPWGKSVSHLKPNSVLVVSKILDPMKWDDALYVRKSVANHLNDITKFDPNFVIKVLKRWKRESNNDPAKSQKIDWITRRALRTEIKNGNPDALRLIGVQSDSALSISKIRISTQQVPWSGSIAIHCECLNQSTEPKNLRLDYALIFLRQNGRTSRKVFVGKTIKLEPQQVLKFQRTYSFRPITTRKYYPGKHQVEWILNGEVKSKKIFYLLET